LLKIAIALHDNPSANSIATAHTSGNLLGRPGHSQTVLSGV